MGRLLQDLRFAWRTMRRTPAFPLAAIATLALGIGATTAIFSTVNAVLLRPLPYPRAQDLYAIRTALTDGRVTTGLLSPVEVLRLNDLSLSIERTVALTQQDLTLLRDDGTPLKTQVYIVSEGFFEMFGLPMALGSGLVHENFAGNGPPVAVISYAVWKNFFGGDPAVVGKSVRFAEVAATIVGVANRAFDTPHRAGFWTSLRLDPLGVNHSFEAYMRLRPGAGLDSVKGQMASVMAGLTRDYPRSDLGRVYVVRPLVESIVGELGPILLIAFAATALLLTLACVNVTNLLLARGAARAREMAVRVALGAGRGRIVRQLLTESILLATAGAAIGLLLAYYGVRLLLALGAATLPRLEAVPFDGHVLFFASVALLVSGVLVGFAPALRLAATDIKTLMNESGRSTGGGRATSRWLAVMTVTEIALAVTLVAGAGWLVRAFAELRTTDPGFAVDGRLTFDVTLQGPKYRDEPTVAAGFHDLIERLRVITGVVAIGSTSDFPLRATPENALLLEIVGVPPDPNHLNNTRQRLAGPGFFDTMGIKLLSGRDFSSDDRFGNDPVVIVNRAFVRRYLSGRDPIGAKFSSGYPTIDPRSTATVVGVVEDVRQRSLSDPGEVAYYNTLTQIPSRRQTIVIRTALADPTLLESAIRDEVRKINPQIAVDFQLASGIVAETIRRQQLGMTLMLIFGGTAVVLAAVGIFGVIAYATAQRRSEVATRLALGATQLNVFWLVLSQGRLLAGVGAGLGLGIAYVAGRVVSSRLYAVRASDPLILGAATLLVAVISLLATMIPAWRAARLDPARVLRPE